MSNKSKWNVKVQNICSILSVSHVSRLVQECELELGTCTLWALVPFGHLYPLGTCTLWALVPFGHLHPLISARGAPTLCTCFNDWQAEHKIKIVQSMYNTLYKPYT